MNQRKAVLGSSNYIKQHVQAIRFREEERITDDFSTTEMILKNLNFQELDELFVEHFTELTDLVEMGKNQGLIYAELAEDFIDEMKIVYQVNRYSRMNDFELLNLIQHTKELFKTPIGGANFSSCAETLNSDLIELKKIKQCQILVGIGSILVILALLAASAVAFVCMLPAQPVMLPLVIFAASIPLQFGIGAVVSMFCSFKAADKTNSLIKKMEPMMENVNAVRCG